MNKNTIKRIKIKKIVEIYQNTPYNKIKRIGS